MSRPLRLAALLAAPAALAALVAGSGAAAQTPPRTLVFKEVDETFSHIRNTKPKTRMTNSAGDVFVLTSKLLDTDGKAAGETAATCITSTGARDYRKSLLTCSGVFTLRDGTLTIQGNVSPANDRIVAAVTGGTGAYAGARGALVFADGVDTITLAP